MFSDSSAAIGVARRRGAGQRYKQILTLLVALARRKQDADGNAVGSYSF